MGFPVPSEGKKAQEVTQDAQHPFHPFVVVCVWPGSTDDAGGAGCILRPIRGVYYHRPAHAAGVSAACYSRQWLSLDAGLLGMGIRLWRLLLGAGNVGAASRSW